MKRKRKKKTFRCFFLKSFMVDIKDIWNFKWSNLFYLKVLTIALLPVMFQNKWMMLILQVMIRVPCTCDLGRQGFQTILNRFAWCSSIVACQAQILDTSKKKSTIWTDLYTKHVTVNKIQSNCIFQSVL